MGKQADAPTYSPAGSGQPATSYQNAAQGQAEQSHVNTNGAFGSSSWAQDPGTGQWTESQGFNPGLQGTVNSLEQQMSNTSTGADAANAAYQQATSRLNPQFAQGQEGLSSQLAAQGLDPGTEAANNAQGNFDRAKNDAYSSAQNNAFQQGIVAQQQPYNHLQALQQLLGGAQSPGAAQGAQYLQALGLNQGLNTNNADTANQTWGGALQGAGAAGGALASLSDERAKFHVERLQREAIPGVPWALFEYRAAPGYQHIGVIAQDVQKVRPDLVHERPDGLLTVDYRGLR